MSENEKQDLRQIAGNMGTEEMYIVAAEFPTKILFDVLTNRAAIMEEKVLSMEEVMKNRSGRGVRREISVIGGV